jgi:hypothetical protein
MTAQSLEDEDQKGFVGAVQLQTANLHTQVRIRLAFASPSKEGL